MRMTQMNTKCSGRIPGLLLLMGMLWLCGCADRSSDAYFFDQTETMDETGNTEIDGEWQEILHNDVLQNESGIGEKTGMEELLSPETEQSDAISQLSVCIVHICGAVKNPGVYELPEGSRVMDAVEAGGGFLEEADQAACNLAQPVVDGCQIYIMTKEESSALDGTVRSAGIQEAETLTTAGKSPASEQIAADGSKDGTAASEKNAGKVNLNTADASALKTLPGIGDSRAAAIIAYREEHGQFTRIEDIMKVSGIKQAAFEKIKDRITV